MNDHLQNPNGASAHMVDNATKQRAAEAIRQQLQGVQAPAAMSSTQTAPAPSPAATPPLAPPQGNISDPANLLGVQIPTQPAGPPNEPVQVFIPTAPADTTITPTEPAAAADGAGALPGGAPAPASTIDPQRLQQIDSWASGLEPSQWLLLEAAMSGQLDPRTYAAITGQPLDIQQQQSQPLVTQPPEPKDYSAYADPDMAREFDAFKLAVAQDMQKVQSAADYANQSIHDTRNAQLADAQNVAARTVMERHNLTVEQMQQIGDVAQYLGVAPSLFAQHPNADPSAVYERVFEIAYRADDNFYAAHIESQAEAKAQAKITADTRASQQAEDMKRNAGTIGAIADRGLPRVGTPVDVMSLSPEQRQEAAAHMIKQYRNTGSIPTQVVLANS